MSDPSRLAPETLLRVRNAVAKLNYTPNEMARGLKRSSSRLIGVIVTDIRNEFHAIVASTAQSVALSKGYTAIICSTSESSDREAKYLEALQSHQLAGLLIVPTENTKTNLRKNRCVPIVEVDRTSGLAHAHVVLADNLIGSSEAVAHFISLGHRKIATIAGRQRVTTGKERLQGYLDRMRQSNLPIQNGWIIEAKEHNEAQGYEAAKQLLNLSHELRPTALLCFNNETTAGALRAAYEFNVQIPRELSVIGFDDSRWGRLMTPPLCVVSQPALEIGRVAAEHLFSLIETPQPNGRTIRLPTRLIIRETTAPPLL